MFITVHVIPHKHPKVHSNVGNKLSCPKMLKRRLKSLLQVKRLNDDDVMVMKLRRMHLIPSHTFHQASAGASGLYHNDHHVKEQTGTFLSNVNVC